MSLWLAFLCSNSILTTVANATRFHSHISQFFTSWSNSRSIPWIHTFVILMTGTEGTLFCTALARPIIIRDMQKLHNMYSAPTLNTRYYGLHNTFFTASLSLEAWPGQLTTQQENSTVKTRNHCCENVNWNGYLQSSIWKVHRRIR